MYVLTSVCPDFVVSYVRNSMQHCLTPLTFKLGAWYCAVIPSQFSVNVTNTILEKKNVGPAKACSHLVLWTVVGEQGK